MCFEERAGEIVFGADETDLSAIPNNYFNTGSQRDILTWDSLQWGHMYNSLMGPEPKFINFESIGAITASLEVEPKTIWNSNSADMGYILFQKPSRVFIHSNDLI